MNDGSREEGRKFRERGPFLMRMLERWHRAPGVLGNSRKDEREQSIIRSVIAAIMAMYALVYVRPATAGQPIHDQLVLIVALYVFFTLMIFGWVLARPAPNRVRRVTAMVADIAILSYAMAVSGAHGAGWYPAYLWVAFGNGFRFGIRYLYLATAFSLAGFLSVVILSPFWNRYFELGIGLAVGLVVLPLYVSRLLLRLEVAIAHAGRAKAEAEHANQEKSRFLASMSHELRTPLNGVIATSDVLADMSLPNEARGLVQTIQASAQTLLGLINDILDIGKIESGRMEKENTAFRLRDTLLNVCEILQPVAERKGLDFSLYCGVDIPDRLIGDPAHLKQILLNILGNAVKFTEEGGVALRVARVPDPQGEGRVLLLFSIIDSGIGIEEEARERIFEAFTQASASVTRTHGGTGLGVTIARELTELLGGSIRLESECGIGTTFHIHIPFEVEPARDTGLPGEQVLALLYGPAGEIRAQLEERLLALGVAPDAVCELAGEAGLAECMRKFPGKTPVLFLDGRIHHAATILQGLRRQVSGIRFLSSVAYAVPADEAESLIRSGLTTFFPAGGIESEHVRRALLSCVHPDEARAEAWGADPERVAAARILVADDNVTNREILDLTLSRAGHETVAVASGAQALEQLLEQTFDLVILDMNMGDMGGIEVLQHYRMMRPDSALPFMLLTADATPEARRIAEQAGFSEILTKPFRAPYLLSVVAHLAGCRAEDTEAADEVSSGDDLMGEDVPGDDVIDMHTIHSLQILSGNDPGFLSRLYEEYMSDAGQLITRMECALIAHQYEAFLDLAHALKGSSGHIGAAQVYRCCQEIDEVPLNDIPSRGPDLLRRTGQALQRTGDPLARVLCVGATRDGYA
ncbi:MAG TPA: response regulator [Gammaproteobacteria bacterium]|nr:response regulator [Gammaproteobacteria bacterium]